MVLLFPPAYCVGKLDGNIISSFRRLAWPGLLGVGIFSKTEEEFAEK